MPSLRQTTSAHTWPMPRSVVALPPVIVTKPSTLSVSVVEGLEGARELAARGPVIVVPSPEVAVNRAANERRARRGDAWLNVHELFPGSREQLPVEIDESADVVHVCLAVGQADGVGVAQYIS